MAGPLLIGAEGVLLVPDKQNYGSSRPIIEGLELAMQLKPFPTSRTTVLVGIEDTTMGDYFVKVHGLAGVNVKGINPEDRDIDPAEAQWFSITRERARGPVNLVLTAWHSVYEHCRATHQPVLLYGRRGSLGELDNQSDWRDIKARLVAHRDAEAETMAHDQVE